MLAALLNGVEVSNVANALSIADRGLNYGDGVFETMLVQGGNARCIEGHIARLRFGCNRLAIPAPDDDVVHGDIRALVRKHSDGILKLIVTRGAGGRGYRSASDLSVTRIAMLYPPLSDANGNGIAVRWCATRLARNPLLAGIKHLNRLEQVLAQNEWTGRQFAEGLMLDTEGELICGTASNIFIVNDGMLLTPDLRFSGVRGVMREQVKKLARDETIPTEEHPLRPDDLLNSSEAFVTNAIRGIRPIVALDDRRWAIGPITQRLMAALDNMSK